MKMFLIQIALFISFIPKTFALTGIEDQFSTSFKRVVENATMADVYPGFVVASPSRENPNYYFDWVRDTALTMRALIDIWEISSDPNLKKMILTWIKSENFRQTQPTLGGLGEPKYNIDGTGYTGPWGRPQNDGPALRAISMIKVARLLIDQGEKDLVLSSIYSFNLPANSPLKRDLEYTAQKWTEPNFDPWEEEKGMHFYNLMVQHTALQEGSKLAFELGDFGAAVHYEKTSKEIGTYIKSNFLDDKIGIIVSKNVVGPLGYKNSGIDVAPLLALNHTWPYQTLVSLKDPYVKKYIGVLTSTFKNLYPVNKMFPEIGVAIGRYPEDKYNGYDSQGQGNPWFLTTLALGEFYCLANGQSITSPSERQFERALFHSNRLGRFDEQFNLHTGNMQGARELTWSHGAFLTAVMRCRLI